MTKYESPFLGLVNESEAGKILGVSVATLRRWRLLKNGPTYRKLNGSVRYAVSDLNNFIDKCAVIATRSVA